MKQEMDERQQAITLKAIAFGGIFVVLCMIVAIAVDIVNTGDVGWEFWALIGASLVMLISRRVMGDVEAPKDMFNRPLPTGDSKEDRRERKKDYALQSLVFASAFAVMDLVLAGFGVEDLSDLEFIQAVLPSANHVTAVAVTVVFAFVSMFAVSYVCEYLIGEQYKVKTYNRMMAELDCEEDDDDC